MRFPTIAGYAAAAALLVASLGPVSAAVVRHPVQFGPAVKDRVPQFVKWQAAGEMAAPILPKGMQLLVKSLRQGRPNLKMRPDAKTGLYVSSTGYSYIIDMNKKGTKATGALDTLTSGCEEPIGIKVDGSRNLWVACEFDENTETGTIAEYVGGGSSSSNPAVTYYDPSPYACPPSKCFFNEALATDVAFSTNGRLVFAANIEDIAESSSSFFCCNGSVVYWKASKPTQAPTSITDPYMNNPIYLDVDNSGNVYVSGDGCISSSDCGVVVDEYTPTSSGGYSVTNIVAPGYIGFAGGVYVSNGGTVLNLTDQIARTTTQYALPWTGTGGVPPTPLNIIGPTFTNLIGEGDPVSGGFNKNDTDLAEGDAYGWLDTCKVPGSGSSTCSAHANINFSEPEGAAYTPSDK